MRRTRFCTALLVGVLILGSLPTADAQGLRRRPNRPASETAEAPPAAPGEQEDRDWFATLPAELQESILWQATQEDGTTDVWGSFQSDIGKPWITGDGSWKLVTAPTHTGKYAIATTIDTGRGSAGVRWHKVWLNPGFDGGVLPTDAYYSAWIMFPEAFSSDWYNLMQWKSEVGGDWSDPVWCIEAMRENDGHMYLAAYSFVGNDGKYNSDGVGRKATGTMRIEPGQWFHLECRYKWSREKTGVLTCWLDGVQQFDFQDVQTEYDYPPSKFPRQWAVNAYGESLRPSPHTMYLDDAAISTARLHE